MELSAVTSLCETCFNIEDSEHKSLHSFFRVVIKRAEGLPDDREAQGRELYKVGLISETPLCTYVQQVFIYL